MPEICVKELLHREVISALKQDPCISLLNTTDGLEGAYPAERLDLQDGFDPSIAPCVFVSMPELGSSESAGPNISRGQFQCNLYLFFPEIIGTTADVRCSELVFAVKASLAAYSYTANMRKIGGYRNAAVVNDVGWVSRGQDKGFLLTASYTLTFPKQGVVSID